MSVATQSALSVNNASYETCLAWAQKELGNVDFGDNRINKRLIRIVANFMANPQGSIPQSSGNWAATKGTYRLFDNKNVDPDAIYEGHRQSCLKRAKGKKVLLSISDTTKIEHTNHPETKGLGPLTTVHHHGLLYHPTYVMTPERVPMSH